jgi:hypothetical protein
MKYYPEFPEMSRKRNIRIPLLLVAVVSFRVYGIGPAFLTLLEVPLELTFRILCRKSGNFSYISEKFRKQCPCKFYFIPGNKDKSQEVK